jgi:glutaredoxin 3
MPALRVLTVLPLIFSVMGCGEGVQDARARAPGEPIGAERVVSNKADTRAGPAQSAVIIEAADASILDEPGQVSDAKAFFSFVDESGSSHLVQGLHNVPTSHQAVAKNMSRGGVRRINQYDATSLQRTAQNRRSLSGADFNPNRLDITMFSATWCGACKRAKQLLDSEGVEYTLRDIDEDPSAKDEVRRVLGSVRIPLIDINGTYVTGYDRKTITRLIRGG